MIHTSERRVANTYADGECYMSKQQSADKCVQPTTITLVCCYEVSHKHYYHKKHEANFWYHIQKLTVIYLHDFYNVIALK